MSKDIEPLFFNIFTNLDKEQKPLFRVMKDNSDLNVNSKKFRNSINIQHFRETNFFDPNKSNLNDINFESNIFNKNNSKDSNNIFLKKNNEPPSENINQGIKLPNNNRSNISSSNQSNNFNLMQFRKKNPVKKRKQNIKNKRNKSRILSNNSSMYFASNIPSKRSKSSANSTKRTKRSKKSKNEVIIPDSPDDYLSIDSDSEEEVKEVNKINKVDNNNYYNNRNKSSYFNKIIAEKENTWKNREIKEGIEQQLEGFDLITIDLKSTFRDPDFQNKYLKDLKAKIKIVYFDKAQIPLQAIFCFCGKNGDIFGREKKLFSGAYDKNEFIQFCEKLIKSKNSATVELLVDFADMNKENYNGWIKPNKNLLIDFYFLVDILNYN